MNLTRFELLWRINYTSDLSRAYFYCWGLPAISRGNHLYKTYTQRVPQSQGGTSLQGYKNLTIQFPPMTAQQVNIIYSIINQLTNNTIYMTVPKDNASGLNDAFIDISGITALPDFDYAPGSSGRVYPGVQLVVNNITVTSDPSTAI